MENLNAIKHPANLHYEKFKDNRTRSEILGSLVFTPSENFTIGVELEIQLINPTGNDLIPRASELLQKIADSNYSRHIKPEITQSMLEINSSVHTNPDDLYAELLEIQEFLSLQAKQLGINLSGGGSHPFQMWNERKIYPMQKFEKAASKYGYLAKAFTVFGLHIHIGCADSNDAIYLMNALAKFIPHFIALSASSPFCQGVDTDFDSARANVVNAFPLSGLSPSFLTWEEFSDYISQMKNLELIKGVENFYWDIRPKPELGTVELRVCDMPLTVERVTTIAAFAQTLAYHILTEKNMTPCPDKYHLYQYNRFQASRHGFDGRFIDFDRENSTTLGEDISMLCEKLQPYAEKLGNIIWHQKLNQNASSKHNDAHYLRSLYEKTNSLAELVQLQSQLWMEDFAIRSEYN